MAYETWGKPWSVFLPRHWEMPTNFVILWDHWTLGRQQKRRLPVDRGGSFIMTDSTIIQFNWRRHWKKKVLPHLNEERVQEALDLGMSLCEPTWKRGDAPYLCGGVNGREAVEGKLSWYQPSGRCFSIAPFSLVIGQINYPDLSWKLLTSTRHCVPVGYGPGCEPRVVMDILNFNMFTAELSLACSDPRITDEQFWTLYKKRNRSTR